MSKAFPNILGMTRPALIEWFGANEFPRFRADQVYHWLYHHRVLNPEQMTNLPNTLRALIKTCIVPLDRFKKMESQDGSIKYIFSLEDDHEIEAVYMPNEKKSTLCLSSQVGCAVDCRFCMTAKMGFIRNLTSAELTGQVMAIMIDQSMPLPFNIVMMGMGEPLLNLKNLELFLQIITDHKGLGLSSNRVTVSTAGHMRNLAKLFEGPVLPRVAISLNASNDAQRAQLMPINDKWSISDILKVCRDLPIRKREKVTFEYVLIEGVNASPEDARQLAKRLANHRCKVNLIPFNETPQLPFQQPSLASIEQFHDILNSARITNTIRWSRGRDIGAACGQLARSVTV